MAKGIIIDGFEISFTRRRYGGRYFITSEQAPHGPRMYSVRSFDEAGSIDTVGEFNSHASRADAMAALREHVKATPAAMA